MREDYLNSDKNTTSKDKEFENILRPKSFNDFFGQDQILKNIKVFVKAAKKRSEGKFANKMDDLKAEEKQRREKDSVDIKDVIEDAKKKHQDD